jgi:hypothetical protein
MTTENTTTTLTIDTDTVTTPSNDTAPESKPKRSFEQASQDRIAFHMNVSVEKRARLAELTEGSKAHTRCLAALAKNEAFIAELQAKLAARLEKRASKSVEAPAAEIVAA